MPVHRAPIDADRDHTEHGLSGLIRRLEETGEEVITVAPHGEEWVVVTRPVPAARETRTESVEVAPAAFGRTRL